MYTILLQLVFLYPRTKTTGLYSNGYLIDLLDSFAHPLKTVFHYRSRSIRSREMELNATSTLPHALSSAPSDEIDNF